MINIFLTSHPTKFDIVSTVVHHHDHHHHHHHHHDHHHQFTTIMLTVCLVSVRKEVDRASNNHLQELEKSMRKSPSTILSYFIVLRFFLSYDVFFLSYNVFLLTCSDVINIATALGGLNLRMFD